MAKKNNKKKYFVGGGIAVIIMYFLSGNLNIGLLNNNSNNARITAQSQTISQFKNNDEVKFTIVVKDENLYIDDEQVTPEDIWMRVNEGYKVVVKSDDAKQKSYEMLKIMLEDAGVVIIEE